MKALVTVKRVVDPYVAIRVNPDGSGVDARGVKHTINPFDEIAVEEAVRLREQHIVNEVVAISIGPESAQETLRHALAMGADQAILVVTELALCSLSIAKIIKKIVELKNPQLILMGKQSIDGDNNQTPQMLAGLLNWPQATYAAKINICGHEIEVVRETDSGDETLKLSLPAIVSADLRLNEPRRINLMQLMKAKQKTLTLIKLEDLGVILKQHTQILRVSKPDTKRSMIKLESAEDLINILNDKQLLGA